MTTRPLADLCRLLEYSFSDPALLEDALTHRSVGAVNNERLEFLGDGALNFVIAHELFRRYPDMQEGDLSRLRASLVNGESLADIAVVLGIGDYVRLGTGEKRSGGHRRASILADCIESIIGAVYCDSDFESCRHLILRLFADKLEHIPDVNSIKDAKTCLQEILQARQIPIPVYEVLNVSGMAHQQTFEVSCTIAGMDITVTGTGKSRRKAEQKAAKAAIDMIEAGSGSGS